MSEKFIHDVREKVIKMEKISQIQETLQNMATLMVGYPDASKKVRLAPKTGGD